MDTKHFAAWAGGIVSVITILATVVGVGIRIGQQLQQIGSMRVELAEQTEEVEQLQIDVRALNNFIRFYLPGSAMPGIPEHTHEDGTTHGDP